MDFEHVIGTRYSSPEIEELWTQKNKILNMRDLWIQLAKNQMELGIDCIDKECIDELIENKENIDLERVDYYEKKLKHDVMANIHAYAELCPKANKIIHLGVTSNYVQDNTDLILIKKSLKIILENLKNLIRTIERLSNENILIPTLAYTHLQKAQLITVGKRFSMWNYDLLENYKDGKYLHDTLPFRGVKGTVGSEDTILKLFNYNDYLCNLLNNNLKDHYGFSDLVKLSGQTYSRRFDVKVFQFISVLSQTIYKIMNDIRLLSSQGELFEEFGENQVGSSAMPYKKNPIQCEQMCSITRYIIQQENCMSQTYMNQWLERSLDDSAIKRIIYPDILILINYVLTKSNDIMNGLYINHDQLRFSVEKHMLNVISEELIINGVKMNHSRQDIHERIRIILTKNNPNLQDLLNDPILFSIFNNSNVSLDPTSYIGRCYQQVMDFHNYLYEVIENKKINNDDLLSDCFKSGSNK